MEVGTAGGRVIASSIWGPATGASLLPVAGLSLLLGSLLAAQDAPPLRRPVVWSEEGGATDTFKPLIF
jgi:hypothetical protein